MTTKLSSKNQIVIPKVIREQAHLQPEAVLYPSVNADGDIVLSKRPAWQRNGGKLRGVWTHEGDPAELIRNQRDTE